MLRLGADAIDVSGWTIDQDFKTPRNPSEEVSTSNLAPRPTFWPLDHIPLSNNTCVCANYYRNRSSGRQVPEKPSCPSLICVGVDFHLELPGVPPCQLSYICSPNDSISA